MAMIRFIAFTPADLEMVKQYEAAEKANPDAINPQLAEKYRALIQDNFGKLMSTMIGEIARFFDITIKRKFNWEGYYGWKFSYHEDIQCWYGVSYSGDNFLSTCFAMKCSDEYKETIDTLVDDEGYRRVPFDRDGSEWVVKEFKMDVFGISDDQQQMEAFSKVAEDQLDLIGV